MLRLILMEPSLDGASLEAGGGGVIRNRQGRIPRGFADHFLASSGMEAKLKAVLRGLELAEGIGENIWIEVDAQEVVGMIEKGKWEAVEYRHVLTEIGNRFKGRQFRITHIPREGNRIVDYLAKQGGRQEQRFEFEQESAPAFVRALERMDKLNIPNIRQSIEDFEDAT